MPEEKLAIFTICSNNYMPMAKVLLASVRKFHPEADLFICLADGPVPMDGLYGHEAELVSIETLMIPDLPGFTFRYDVMELNTAVKPFMFLFLFEHRLYERVLYFDPDIEVFARLDAILIPLAEGATFAVTPHILEPAEWPDQPNDLNMLRAGTYNLGFLGARSGESVLTVLHWWARRLLYQCYNDQNSGLFVDQKFFDLVPGFVSSLAILRDSTLNVAYWNLKQRVLIREDENWIVDGRPLTFFHYSGFDPNKPSHLSKHTKLFEDGIDASLASLLGRYAAQLLTNGWGSIPRALYAYGRFKSGTPIPYVVRQMFRDRHPAWPSDPFETFEEHLHQLWPGAASATVTNFVAYLHETSPYLSSCMDVSTLHGQMLLVDWYIKHAARDLSLDSRLVEPVAATYGYRLPTIPIRTMEPERSDVSVIGYLRTTSGVGEGGRANLTALSEAGLRVNGYDVDLGVVADRSEESASAFLTERPDGRVRLFHLNADQLPLVMEHLRPLLETPAYTIVTPAWELADFPDAWLPAFDAVDEVWTQSRYVQLMLVRKLHKPVLHMRVALQTPVVASMRRRDFLLPEGRFLFFFAFDFLSFVERKNPSGAIEAFRRAFGKRPRGVRPALVVKVLNGALAPAALQELREQVEQDADIFLVERTLARPEVAALIGLCDAVLSLHRAEGFGLLIAEAMQLGRPVIATDYAATTELLSPVTGYPVDYRLVPVPPAAYPFGDGQVWADPDLDHAAWLMARLADEPGLATERVAAARAHLDQNYSPRSVAATQLARLRELGLVPRPPS